MAGKRPRTAAKPTVSKIPVVAENPEAYHRQKPSWHFGKMQFVDPFGWHALGAGVLEEICTKMGEFERLTWTEILVRDRRRNHSVPIDRLDSEAQKRLRKIGLDMEILISLRLSGPKRVWGVMRNGVLELLWWDPDHLVCPSLGANN